MKFFFFQDEKISLKIFRQDEKDCYQDENND